MTPELQAQSDSAVSAVVHVIQLSVAPVFLLSGVGTILVVLTNRLSRIVDRTRLLEQTTAAPTPTEAIKVQLDSLHRRAHLINWALSLATLCALLICGVIGALFIGAFFRINASKLVAVAFVIAMAALVGALLNFLREIFLATSGLRRGH
ncbi:MAG TPA: DUF2721 domain-containing protein [Gemmatimonadales bacterium]|jgi:hypothetical protein|nr:DUF2721 domain-containing protein [Gemmatimonadales bacterium]